MVTRACGHACGHACVRSPDGVVRAAADHQPVAVLQTRDAALVPVQRAHKLARRRVPHLDGAVARRRDDVLVIEVDDVDGGTMADEDTTEVDVRRRLHVPNGDRTVLQQTRG